MKLKKLTKALLLISAVLLLILCFTACDEEHEHTFSDWETVTKPTCSAEGLKTRACDCGFVELEAISALSHTPVVDPAVEATCTERGKTEGSHCGVCGAVIVAATETDTLAHSFSVWETLAEADCTSHGLQKQVCDCGHTEYKITDKKAHTPVVDPAIDATCTEQGKTEGSHCGVCGTVIVAGVYTDTVDHDFSAWETVEDADCTSHGVRKRVCDCGHTEYAITDKKAHTPVLDTAVAATCTEQGKTEGSHCGVCGTVIVAQEIILPYGHNYSQETVIEEAACDKDGVKRICCTNKNCSDCYEEAYSLEEASSSDIYESASKYTGYLTTYDRFGNYRAEAMGIVISPDGKILTSNLKLDGAFSASFKLGETYYEVTEVLAFSTKSNVAILKIDASGLPSAELCDKTHPAGETVYSFGTVENLKNTILSGNITNPSRYVGGSAYIQHDIDDSNGLIGAPLINKFGEVIGVNVGFSGYSINLSAPASALAELNYDEPLTLAEYCALTYSKQERIRDWVYGNYNGELSNTIYYSVGGSDFKYSIGYDLKEGHCFIDGLWMPSSSEALYVYIILDDEDGVYEYRAEYIIGSKHNQVRGFFEAADFNKNTVLTYDTYYGKYWPEDQLMQLYSFAACDVLEWFSYCLDTYFDDLTLGSFGFESLSYERDAEALDKLNALVMAIGSYDSGSGSYSFTMSKTLSAGTAIFSIVHTPQAGSVAASTVVTVDLYKSGGSAVYSVSVTLDMTENGYCFDALYAESDGSGYAILNTAWGYIEPDTFTDTSSLVPYVFSGLDDYEDTFLANYSFMTCELISWTNMLMQNADANTSVKDLGFLFFFG